VVSAGNGARPRPWAWNRRCNRAGDLERGKTRQNKVECPLFSSGSGREIRAVGKDFWRLGRDSRSADSVISREKICFRGAFFQFPNLEKQSDFHVDDFAIRVE
jgi:hypothetical protein